MMIRLRCLTLVGLVAILAALTLQSAWAFCGFYVAKADTQLFNQASKVVLVRDGERTVLTMANDFQGDPKAFAIVIPVPTFLEKEQIHVGEAALVDHLDAYTAPRLVEYFDPNPCQPVYPMAAAPAAGAKTRQELRARPEAEQLGVKIEAQYTVGEYDILILSAEESEGLETWLRHNGYKLPDGAAPVLGSYIKQNMRFFVAKVNLVEQSKLGFKYLRPLQVAYESPKFMLPIRLGTLNAKGDQELFVFALARKGRVETTNYRTARLPEGVEIPEYVKAEFGDFYKAMFGEQVRRENGRAVFLEYAWDMGWCDPCAADPLTPVELKQLGVFWLDGVSAALPAVRPLPGGAANVFVTRLHLRYNRESFPEDLTFQETADRTNFQGRFVLRHAYSGPDSCPAMTEYRRQVQQRRQSEATTLADLTGWKVEDVRRKMNLEAGSNGAAGGGQWWKDLWP